MEMGLRDTVAFVAGASQGLGEAIVMAMAREGASLAICSRRNDAIEAAAARIGRETGARVLPIEADMSQPDAIRRAISATVEWGGRLDILVTNAGGPPAGEFTQHSDEAWQSAFDTNLMSAVRLVREALPYLQQSGRGRIINLTSTSVKEPISGLVLSNAIRVGVVGLAKTLSQELAPYGITVNNIAPGRFDTERIRTLDAGRARNLGVTEEEARAQMIRQIAMGRYGNPEELAHLAVFLASDKAAYITGNTIQIDGGMVKGLL